MNFFLKYCLFTSLRKDGEEVVLVTRVLYFLLVLEAGGASFCIWYGIFCVHFYNFVQIPLCYFFYHFLKKHMFTSLEKGMGRKLCLLQEVPDGERMWYRFRDDKFVREKWNLFNFWNCFRVTLYACFKPCLIQSFFEKFLISLRNISKSNWIRKGIYCSSCTLLWTSSIFRTLRVIFFYKKKLQ